MHPYIRRRLRQIWFYLIFIGDSDPRQSGKPCKIAVITALSIPVAASVMVKHHPRHQYHRIRYLYHLTIRQRFHHMKCPLRHLFQRSNLIKIHPGAVPHPRQCHPPAVCERLYQKCPTVRFFSERIIAVDDPAGRIPVCPKQTLTDRSALFFDFRLRHRGAKRAMSFPQVSAFLRRPSLCPQNRCFLPGNASRRL